MKKIINGRSYDTDKARSVGSWEASYSYGDFHWYMEELFQKRTGEYFLFGKGGPASPYSRAIDTNSWIGSQDVRPLTVEEARQWAEEHLSASEYEAEFGEVAEDDSRTVLSITIAASTAERLRREAAKAGMSLSAYIESRLN